ncbi:hypothetical protein [Streptomyces pseudogriseolus]|uniref:hypothetical protein n=1 Tax=Streptomyces pseudogriseolus TaxID=36817 RepID=UPI0034826B7D
MTGRRKTARRGGGLVVPAGHRAQIDEVTAAHPRPDFKRQILTVPNVVSGRCLKPSVNAWSLEHFVPGLRLIENSAWPE